MNINLPNNPRNAKSINEIKAKDTCFLRMLRNVRSDGLEEIKTVFFVPRSFMHNAADSQLSISALSSS